jgi:hypothetical protein
MAALKVKKTAQTSRSLERLKIVSDGTMGGTRVYVPGGKLLGGVQRVEFIADVRLPYAGVQLTVSDVAVDLDAKILNNKNVVVIRPQACGCGAKKKCGKKK